MSKKNKKELFPQDIEQYMNYTQPVCNALNDLEKEKNYPIFDKFYSLSVASFFISLIFLLGININGIHEYNKGLSIWIAHSLISSIISGALLNHLKNKNNSIFHKTKIKKLTIFKHLLSKLIQNPHYNYSLSMLAHYYESKKYAKEYRIELYDFFENIKNNNITQKDIKFFKEQHSFIMKLEGHFLEEKKIKAIKNMEELLQYNNNTNINTNTNISIQISPDSYTYVDTPPKEKTLEKEFNFISN